MRFTVDRLDHMVLCCRDMEITASWYQRVLGMEREEFGPRNRTALRFGGQKINLDPVSEFLPANAPFVGMRRRGETIQLASDHVDGTKRRNQVSHGIAYQQFRQRTHDRKTRRMNAHAPRMITTVADNIKS